MISQRKAKPLCEKPVSGVFSGPDQLLRLQTISIREHTAPIAEDDSLFVYVTSGHGYLTVNGVVFDLKPGSFAWLQSYHVFSIEPVWDETLELTVVVYDYPLSSYMTFRTNQNRSQNLWAFATSPPVFDLEEHQKSRVESLLQEYTSYNDDRDCGSNLIKCAILGQLSYEFFSLCDQYHATHPYSRRQWPMGWVLTLYIAFYCSEDLSPKEVADVFGISVSTLNRELRIISGMNFAQTLNRSRVNLAASAILFNELSFHFLPTYCGFRSEVAFYRTISGGPLQTRAEEYDAPGISGIRSERCPDSAENGQRDRGTDFVLYPCQLSGADQPEVHCAGSVYFGKYYPYLAAQ